MNDLAKRAVACKHWRWMDGMKPIAGPRLLQDVNGMIDAWPDLTDPATLGCLLALVREAWSTPQLFVETWFAIDTKRLKWCVRGCTKLWDPMRYMAHDTEAEALVAALESAP